MKKKRGVKIEAHGMYAPYIIKRSLFIEYVLLRLRFDVYFDMYFDMYFDIISGDHASVGRGGR